VVETRLHALEKSSEQFAEELAESLRVSERNFNMMEKVLVNVEDLTKTATTMKQVIIELAGCAGEVRREIGVERGRVDSLSGSVLPWLGDTSAKVNEMRTQMAEHREYCGAVLRELRGAAMAGFQHSRDVDMRGVQSVAESAAEGEGSDTGTEEPDERTAEIQRIQEEVQWFSRLSTTSEWRFSGWHRVGSLRLRVCRGRWRMFGARSRGFRGRRRS
jgi:hypothetical protein